MEKRPIPRIANGVSIAALIIILDIILQNTVHPLADGTRYLPRLLIVFAGILVSCLLYARQNGHGSSFGAVFSHGFRTTAAVAFLMAVYTYIAIKWIYPPPSAAEMQAAVKAIEQQGNVLHEEAKQLAAKAAANRWIIYVSLSIFASLIPGLLGALSGAALAKKNQ